MRSCCREPRPGFSLIEVLVALAIVGLVLGATATVLRQWLIWATRAAQRCRHAPGARRPEARRDRHHRDAASGPERRQLRQSLPLAAHGRAHTTTRRPRADIDAPLRLFRVAITVSLARRTARAADRARHPAPRAGSAMKRRSAGFTLIEVLIALALDRHGRAAAARRRARRGASGSTACRERAERLEARRTLEDLLRRELGGAFAAPLAPNLPALVGHAAGACAFLTLAEDARRRALPGRARSRQSAARCRSAAAASAPRASRSEPCCCADPQKFAIAYFGAPTPERSRSAMAGELGRPALSAAPGAHHPRCRRRRRASADRRAAVERGVMRWPRRRARAGSVAILVLWGVALIFVLLAAANFTSRTEIADRAQRDRGGARAPRRRRRHAARPRAAAGAPRRGRA